MSWSEFARRTVLYHWRQLLAVFLAAAVASTVLTGALLVGDSMRGTLRALTEERLGNIETAVVGAGFFPADLANRAQASLHANDAIVASAIVLRGSVRNLSAGIGAAPVTRVHIIGTTAEFWKLFPGIADPDQNAKRVIANQALAAALGLNGGGRLAAAVEKASAIPRETVLGDRQEIVREIPFKVDEIIPDRGVGRFGLAASQRTPLNLFVPLAELAKGIDQAGKANTLFSNSRGLESALAEASTLADFGVRLRRDDTFGYVSVESERLVFGDPLLGAAKAAAASLGATAQPVLTYLANEIRVGTRRVPYSIVVALELTGRPPLGVLPVEPNAVPIPRGGILLNRWTARELDAKIGDRVTLSYYRVLDSGALETAEHSFDLAGIVEMEGLGLDRGFVPEYPGISDAKTFADWEPPFPIDLKKVRPVDEDYWRDYRTTPKGFVRLDDGRELWSSRFGDVTSVRVAPAVEMNLGELRELLARDLRAHLEPESMGLVVQPIRSKELAASRGSTDFGGLFLAFSSFLIVSAAMLVGLMFRLSVERRAGQVGVLRAVGVPAVRIRRWLVLEGLGVCFLGASAGLLGAVGYARAMLAALGSWWWEAVQTEFLAFYLGPFSFLYGLLGSLAVALVAILWAVAALGRARVPGLLQPGFTFASARVGPASPWPKWIAAVCGACGVVWVLVAAFTTPESVASFFGAGAILLVAGIAALAAVTSGRPGMLVRGSGRSALIGLGIRNGGRYPARSLLTATLIGLATFIIVAVGSMRHGEADARPQKDSGDGGFQLVVETDVPLLYNPGDEAGREELGLPASLNLLLEQSETFPFRVRSGEDASCLNIYQPRNPTLLGASRGFIERGGFAFSSSMADTPEEAANPWLLLDRRFDDGAIPAIGDANTLQWILKVPLGQTLEIEDERGRRVKLRIVAALAGSLFQGELVVAESRLKEAFPGVAGFRFFLIAIDSGGKGLQNELAKALQRYGPMIETTAERIAAFRAVENTYMAAFQLLGGLGLLLGTLGLAAVLYRNVLERQGELGLLRAVGFRKSAIGWLVLSETAFLLVAGMLIGAGAAAVAVSPRWVHLFLFEPVSASTAALASVAGTLLAVFVFGLLAGLVAVWTALGAPLIPALRRE